MAPGKYDKDYTPNPRPAYRPINQYDYPVDEGKDSGGFFTRHRKGFLVFFSTAALLSVLGACCYFVISSSLLDKVRASLPSTDTSFRQTEVPQTEAVVASSFATEPIITVATEPIVSMAAEPIVAMATAPAVAVPAEADIAPLSEPVSPRSAAFPEILASVQTKQNTNENRISNLQVLCQALNGIVLEPGQVLSFNEAVGERSAENGYKAAPGYSGNGTPDMMGGGTNQGASMLYSCALLAELEIVERTNGEYLPVFLDPGMDAAVSWPVPDLKLRNSTDGPIQISAEADRDFVTMEIRGTKPRDYDTKLEYMMTTLYTETVYQEQSPDGPYGDGELLQSGHDGAYVRTFLCKYSKQTGELLSQEEAVYSFYPMEQRIIVRVSGQLPTAPEEPTESQEPTVPSETQPPEAAPPTEPQGAMAPALRKVYF